MHICFSQFLIESKEHAKPVILYSFLIHAIWRKLCSEGHITKIMITFNMLLFFFISNKINEL